MEVKAPYKFTSYSNRKVFLAGSIEMGTAENWQDKVVKRFPEDVIVLNPRRDNWDSSWEQSIDNPQFREQVEWELEGLEGASVILLYFDPNTKSPITLLELGLFGEPGKMIVCCPNGFWRKGNVDMVCNRYDIEQVDSLDELISRGIDYLLDNQLYDPLN